MYTCNAARCIVEDEYIVDYDAVIFLRSRSWYCTDKLFIPNDEHVLLPLPTEDSGKIRYMLSRLRSAG